MKVGDLVMLSAAGKEKHKRYVDAFGFITEVGTQIRNSRWTSSSGRYSNGFTVAWNLGVDGVVNHRHRKEEIKKATTKETSRKNTSLQKGDYVELSYAGSKKQRTETNWETGLYSGGYNVVFCGKVERCDYLYQTAYYEVKWLTGCWTDHKAGYILSREYSTIEVKSGGIVVFTEHRGHKRTELKRASGKAIAIWKEHNDEEDK